MLVYENLGFTEREAEILDKLLVEWQNSRTSKSHSYTMTIKGAPINLDVDKWKGEYYLSVLERNGVYTGVLDTGHGYLFILNTETGEIGYTSMCVASINGAVMLNAEYYGLSNWIFVSK